jgi:hypothetical protein
MLHHSCWHICSQCLSRLKEHSKQITLLDQFSLHRLLVCSYHNTDTDLTDWFPVTGGTRQGAVLSPFLFFLIISPLAEMLRDMNMGTLFGNTRVGYLLFVDDIVLVADTTDELQAMMLMLPLSSFDPGVFKCLLAKQKLSAWGTARFDLRARFWYTGGCVVQCRFVYLFGYRFC